MHQDFEKLQHWMKLLRADKTLMTAVSERMAGVTLALIERGFDTEKNPYGEKWAPKKRRDGRKVLHGKTLRLSRGWRRRRVDARRFELFPSVDYAAFHQDPKDTRRMPARLMVPTRLRGLPRAWKTALSRSAIEQMRKHYESK